MARQAVDGHPLMRDLVRGGSSVHSRVVAIALELARGVPLMQRWAVELDAVAFQGAFHCADDASGVGRTEAARGALGHWLGIEQGAIAN